MLHSAHTERSAAASGDSGGGRASYRRNSARMPVVSLHGSSTTVLTGLRSEGPGSMRIHSRLTTQEVLHACKMHRCDALSMCLNIWAAC